MDEEAGLDPNTSTLRGAAGDGVLTEEDARPPTPPTPPPTPPPPPPPDLGPDVFACAFDLLRAAASKNLSARDEVRFG